MKVELQNLTADEEECAVLHTDCRDASIERLKEFIEKDEYRTTVLLGCQDGKKCRIYSSNIFYIESVKDMQYIHTFEGVYETRERLYVLMTKLPPWFVRCSRSGILNVRQVQRYVPLTGGLMCAEFLNGEKAYISRKYVREIRDVIREELI